MSDRTVTVREEERQMILLALAKLAVERPGWVWTLGELAAKFDDGDPDSAASLFAQFRAIHAKTGTPT